MQTDIVRQIQFKVSLALRKPLKKAMTYALLMCTYWTLWKTNFLLTLCLSVLGRTIYTILALERWLWSKKMSFYILRSWKRTLKLHRPLRSCSPMTPASRYLFGKLSFLWIRQQVRFLRATKNPPNFTRSSLIDMPRPYWMNCKFVTLIKTMTGFRLLPCSLAPWSDEIRVDSFSFCPYLWTSSVSSTTTQKHSKDMTDKD